MTLSSTINLALVRKGAAVQFVDEQSELWLQVFIERAWADKDWKVFKEAVEYSRNKFGWFYYHITLDFSILNPYIHCSDGCDISYTLNKTSPYHSLRVSLVPLWITIDFILVWMTCTLQCKNNLHMVYVSICLLERSLYSLSKSILLQHLHIVAKKLLC
jgi:hypothetical protein